VALASDHAKQACGRAPDATECRRVQVRSIAVGTPIQVIVGEDHYLVREGLRQLIDAQPDIEAVAYCDELESLQKATDELQPDVVVTDIRMPPRGSDEGIRFATWAREVHPELGVVVLSQYAFAEYALRLFETGAFRRAYLLKNRIAGSGQLASAIREVANGGTAVDTEIVESLVAARMRVKRSPLAELTPRELEVVGLVAQGKSNASIAAAMFLTKRAVEKHINAIFAKLNLPDDSVQSRRVAVTLLYLSDGSRPLDACGTANAREPAGQ
jgi:DNA-binding NarL/FixJ family response regulator